MQAASTTAHGAQSRVLRSRREAAAIIERWRRHYDEVRPHSSLAYLTPEEFKRQNEIQSHQAQEAIL
jgi:putative transposase